MDTVSIVAGINGVILYCLELQVVECHCISRGENPGDPRVQLNSSVLLSMCVTIIRTWLS